MSKSREKDNDSRKKCNPYTEFTFKGSQATGDSGGNANNVWNFGDLVRDEILDLASHKLDFRDNYPLNGEMPVIVNGVHQAMVTNYNCAANTTGWGTTLTFTYSIQDADDVTFQP